MLIVFLNVFPGVVAVVADSFAAVLIACSVGRFDAEFDCAFGDGRVGKADEDTARMGAGARSDDAGVLMDADRGKLV
jgi:hypothetical protein